jgi:hypothetical protein
VATRFAPYAAVAAGNLYAYQSARDMADNLQTALESRAVIDQAKGILMERYKLTADQAFQLLARASMTTNRKVRDIADHLVRTGELPVTARCAVGSVAEPRAPRVASTVWSFPSSVELTIFRPLTGTVLDAQSWNENGVQ